MARAIGIAVFSGMLGVTLLVCPDPGLFRAHRGVAGESRNVGAEQPPRRAEQEHGRSSAITRRRRRCHPRGLRGGPRSTPPRTQVDAPFAKRRRAGLEGGMPSNQYRTGLRSAAPQPARDALAHNKDWTRRSAQFAGRTCRQAAGRVRQYSDGPSCRRLHPQLGLPGSNCLPRQATVHRTPAGWLRRFVGNRSFGRVRRNVEAARGDLGASAATLRAARVPASSQKWRATTFCAGMQAPVGADDTATRDNQ